MLSKNIEYRGNIWGFWGTLFFGMFILIAFLIGQLLPLIFYMIVKGMESFDTLVASFITDSFLLFLSVMGGMLLAVPVALGVAKLKKGSILKDYFSLNGFKWKTLGFWMLLLIVLQIATGYLIEALGEKDIPNFMMNLEYPTLMAKILLLVAVVVGAPVFEEVFFRGFLLKGFSNTFMGTHGAVLLTSALWAVIHIQYEVVYLIDIFVIGVVFAYARLRTNSLFIPMIMHSLINLWATLGLFYEKGVFG